MPPIKLGRGTSAKPPTGKPTAKPTDKPTPTSKPTAPPGKKAPAAPPQKAVTAAAKAEATLQKIREDERREYERVKGDSEQKVLGAEIGWLQYQDLKETQTSDMDECIRIDEYNYSVFQHNNAMAAKINELMEKLGRPTVRVTAPPRYAAISRAKYEEMMFTDDFRMIAAVEYLGKRGICAVRDYAMADAPDMADTMEEKSEIERLVREAGDGGIDISGAAGSTHKNNCTCENRWDGVSERCVGGGVRMRWRRMQDHHFLRPRIIPEKH